MAGYLKTTLLLISLSVAGCAAGPTHDETLNDEGYSAMQAGDMQEAERLLTAAVEENPDNLQALTNLATLYRRTNRPEQARPLYQRVIDGEATAEENDQDPQEAARLAQIARDSIFQMDREEAMRQEAAAAELAAIAAANAPPAQQEPVAPVPVQEEFGHRIQVGAYAIPANAENMHDRLVRRHASLIKGKDVRMVKVAGLTKVQVGPYDTIADANRACRSLKRAGVNCFRIR